MPAETQTNQVVPSNSDLTNLAGAFISIRAANKAIKLQPALILPKTDKGDDLLANLRNINDSLRTTQSHSDFWSITVSANVQNQLQHIVDQSDFHSSMAEPLQDAINTLSKQKAGAAEILDNLNDIHDFAAAIADNINAMLYGVGNTIDNPSDDSVYGTYLQVTDYQKKVGEDEKQFKTYIDLLTSSDAGIDATIKNLDDNIDSYRKAISKDQAMIAGGSAAVATGIGLVVCAVVLAPETGGASIAIGVVGVAAIAGGASVGIYGIVDLMKKEQAVVDAKQRIQQLNADKAAIVNIRDVSQSMVHHTETIFNALDQIVTNWQQMQNNILNTMTAIKAIDDPKGLLQTWINEAQKTAPNQSRIDIMSKILNKKLIATSNDWEKAAAMAAALLKGIANTIERVLPPNTKIDQKTIDQVAKAKAA